MSDEDEVGTGDDQRHEYSASLRVISYSLRLAALIARLGEPSNSHDIGEPVSSKSPHAGLTRHSFWTLRPARNRQAPMDELIADLIGFAEAHVVELDVLRPQCRIDLFCGIFTADAHGGFELPPDLMRRATALDLTIDFDIY